MRSLLFNIAYWVLSIFYTLAAALAAGLAAGLSLQDAVAQSQDFVAQALACADRPRDQGQWLPRRIVTPWRA